MTAKVIFSREITPEKVVELYHALGITLPGKVATKVHSGEKGNQNFLRPDFWKPMVEEVKGTIVECNTAYGDAFGIHCHCHASTAIEGIFADSRAASLDKIFENISLSR